MKELFTFLLLLMGMSVNAKIVYVASTGNNSDGSTWAKALTSIPNNSSSAVAAGDSVFVKTGTYSLSQSTAGWACLATKADVNYLGGFAGSESNSAQRALSDLDVNGIIEPWEFSNATVLNLTATNNAYGLYVTTNTITQRVFDGFKITGSFDAGTLSASAGNTMVRIFGYTNFRNNIIDNCTLTASGTLGASYTKGTLIFIGNGTTATVFNQVDNCLIQNNTSTVTAGSTQTDAQQSPLVHMEASNGSGRNLFANCVIRNNRITVNFSATTLTANYNTRGVLFSMSIQGSGSHAAWNAFKNNVVYNNDATYISPASGAHSLGNGGLIFPYNTNYASTDSIINNTIANNKMTKIGTAIKIGINTTTSSGLQNKTPYHKVLNNTIYNNTNYNGSTTVAANLAVTANPDNTTAGILIANNYSSAGGLSNTTGTNSNIVNNVVDLSTTNSDATKGAWFTAPTANTLIGYSTDASVATSRWNISSSSYLISKGISTSNKYDKANIPFASTPTVGAYEGGDVSIPANTTQTISQTATVKSITLAASAKLTLNAGTLTATNGITLESDAAGTATLLQSGSLTGTVTAKQYLGTARNWYVSSPVNSASAPATNVDYYYEYVEAGDNNPDGQPGSSTAYWKGLTTGTTMAVGKGYIAKASAGTTVQFTGTPNNGNITTAFNLTRNDAKGKGFNLVGNPYPSYLDWVDVAAANPNLDNTYYYRTKNSTSGYTFVTWNGAGSNYVVSNGSLPVNTTVTRFIPPTQAFWVRVKSGTASTTMSFTNAMREHRDDNGNLMKAKKQETRTSVRLQLQNGTESDELLIYQDAAASNGYDAYDSPKMLNNSATTPDLYTKAGDEKLVINGLIAIAENMELPLGFSLNAPSTLKIKATELSNLPEGTAVYLLDKVANTQTELTPATEYSFTTTETTTNDESRFSVLFKAPGVTTGTINTARDQVSVFVNKQNEIVILARENSNYSIYNATGQLITSGKTGNQPVSLHAAKPGVYIVTVNGQSNRIIIQ